MALKKIKKLGFVVHSLNPGQLPYQLITSSNELLRTRDDIDISLFYCFNSVICVEPKFALYGLIDCFSFDGHTVATSIQTASRLLDYPGPRRAGKLYYFCNDLCWIRLQPKQYEQLSQIYLNKDIELIARSQHHFDIIKSVWKEPIGVVENANVARFTELIYS